jgi:hypothetical protein
MSTWHSILARIGRRLVKRDLAGYGAEVETTPAGLKVTFPDGTIWLVRVTVSAAGDPAGLSDVERAALNAAAGGLGATPVLARVRLTRPRRDRRARIAYYDLRASRETHPGLFLSPGGQP